jgi:hypothetical protein
MSTLSEIAAVFAAEHEGERARLARHVGPAHEALAESGQVRALSRVVVGRFPFPVEDAFSGAGPTLTAPYLLRESACFVVEYDDLRGDVRTLVFHPADEERALRAPVMERLYESRVGRGLDRVLSRGRVDLKAALRRAGYVPTDVDFVASPHLMRLDPRSILGGLDEVPLLPRAELLTTRAEWDRCQDPHPAVSRWYVPSAADGVEEGRVRFLDGPELLGAGVALLPLGDDGTLSLAVHTPRGLFVLSDRGVATESWTPPASNISGLADHAANLGWEAVPRRPERGTFADAVTAMVVERELAGAAQEEAEMTNVVPVAPFVKAVITPRLAPTFAHTFEENWRIRED